MKGIDNFMGRIIKDGIVYAGSATNAKAIKYDDSVSGLGAKNVKEAIDILASSKVEDNAITLTQEEFDALSEEEQNSGTYYITDDDDDLMIGEAELIIYYNENSGLEATDVQGAIDEIDTKVVSNTNEIVNVKEALSNKQPKGDYAKISDIPTKVSQLTNDSKYLTSYTETDPTVPAWAKAATKPTYTASEVGATTQTYVDTEIAKVNNALNELESNPLWGKKVSFLGDSICAGADTDVSYLGGYGRIIAERNNMTYQNLGRGGATITAETYSSTSGTAKGWLCRKVDEMDADADYAIVEGGVNDAWQWSDHGTIEIGKITDGYNATLDDTTYYGAFESMLKKLITKFHGKKIGYIAIPKTMNLYDSSRNVPNFYHIALECCAKWGVPVCDLNTITPPSVCLGTTYVPDGTHPNYEGYLKYYCDPIEAWMKTLTTGGNSVASTALKVVEEYTKGFNDAIKALQDGKLNNTGISFKKAKLTLVDGTILEIDVLTAIDGTVVIPFTNRVPISIDTDGSIFNGCGYEYGKRLSSNGGAKDQDNSYVTGYIPAKNGDIIRIYGCDFGTVDGALNYICAYDANFNFIGSAATTAGVSTLTFYQASGEIVTNYSADENLDTTLTLSASNVAYIRVSSAGDAHGTYPEITYDIEDMNVTVNEEIK